MCLKINNANSFTETLHRSVKTLQYLNFLRITILCYTVDHDHCVIFLTTISIRVDTVHVLTEPFYIRPCSDDTVMSHNGVVRKRIVS